MVDKCLPTQKSPSHLLFVFSGGEHVNMSFYFSFHFLDAQRPLGLRAAETFQTLHFFVASTFSDFRSCSIAGILLKPFAAWQRVIIFQHKCTFQGQCFVCRGLQVSPCLQTIAFRPLSHKLSAPVVLEVLDNPEALTLIILASINCFSSLPRSSLFSLAESHFPAQR